MTPLIAVEIPKTKQLILQVASSPKGRDVEVLSPDRPDESFNERVRNRQVRHGFDFGNLEYGTAATLPRTVCVCRRFAPRIEDLPSIGEIGTVGHYHC
jgi:hypothetical protein